MGELEDRSAFFANKSRRTERKRMEGRIDNRVGARIVYMTDPPKASIEQRYVPITPTNDAAAVCIDKEESEHAGQPILKPTSVKTTMHDPASGPAVTKAGIEASLTTLHGAIVMKHAEILRKGVESVLETLKLADAHRAEIAKIMSIKESSMNEGGDEFIDICKRIDENMRFMRDRLERCRRGFEDAHAKISKFIM